MAREKSIASIWIEKASVGETAMFEVGESTEDKDRLRNFLYVKANREGVKLALETIYAVKHDFSGIIPIVHATIVSREDQL